MNGMAMNLKYLSMSKSMEPAPEWPAECLEATLRDSKSSSLTLRGRSTSSIHAGCAYIFSIDTTFATYNQLFNTINTSEPRIDKLAN